jgi:DNA (cytosine-5)-methyltransferase 1
MSAKCCFQIWERKAVLREHVKLSVIHEDWEFLAYGPKDDKGQPTPPHGADFAMRAYGGKIGEICTTNLDKLRPKSWHWIVSNIKVEELLSRFKCLDYTSSLNTARQNSMGRGELVKLYTNLTLSPICQPHPRVIRFVDLFCGLGAFHHAFNSLQRADTKYKCVFACDIDTKVQKLYKENYGFEPEGDIENVIVEDIPDFDILCAGFPCQPFSIAGSKKGFADSRKGNLFYSILRVIDRKSPTTVILENVKNLLSINGGETYETIRKELVKRGYTVKHKVVDSKFYGCPQSRQRVFIIGILSREYSFPEEPYETTTPVSSIVEDRETNWLEYENKYVLEKCKETKSKNSCKMLFRLIHKVSGKGGRQGERVYSIDHCGPTICASSGGLGAKTGLYYINERVRRLNVNETLRMFGFDETYKWNTIVNPEEMLFYLGNCIVVNVLKSLLSNL